MKGKKQKEKKKKTTKEIVSEVRNEFKDEKSNYQILGNAGGDYIKTKLPKDFFESVITGEMSLEYDFSIEKLTKLMDLYSLGIQYFLENDPSRAKSFQDRMGFILTNKDTLLNLKRKQQEEERQKQQKEKSQAEKNEKFDNYSKSAKNLPKSSIRKRAKTNFMMKSQNIKEEEIQRKVTFVLKNDSKIKEEKENVKNIIKDDIDKQNLKWKEKLQMKRNNLNTSFGSGIRPRHRTFFIKMKKFQTPGPLQDRAIMTLKSPNIPKSPTQNNNVKPNFNKIPFVSTKNNSNINFIDVESSQGDDAEKNEGDIDFLKQFKERHNWKEEDKKNEKDNNDKNDEKKDEKKNDDNEDDDSDSDSDSSGTLNSDEFLKKIDEVDEEGFSLRQTAKYDELNKKNERKVSQFKIETEYNKDKDKDKDENEDLNQNKNNENTTIKKDNINEQANSNQKEETKNDFPFLKRKSIVEENIIRNIDPDEEIVKSIEEKMKSLENLDTQNNLDKINGKDDEEENENQTEISSISNNFNPIKDLKLTIDDIPLKYQDTYEEVEEKMKKYVKDLNNHFYKDTFELFSLELKELYDKKYNKYIEVNDEYHHNIKEKEYQLENDENLNEEKKVEIQQIIDGLKEEQKDQVDKITDEFNELIDTKISEFKQTFFKKDCGINLMEEQLKLEIYTMINEAFY